MDPTTSSTYPVAGQTGILEHPSVNGATPTPLGMIRLAPRWHRVEVTDGPFTGLWAEMWLNPPHAIERKTQQRDTFAEGMGALIRAWNVVGFDGEPVPPGEDGIGATPDDLHLALIKAYQAARDFPKTSKGSSGPPI